MRAATAGPSRRTGTDACLLAAGLLACLVAVGVTAGGTGSHRTASAIVQGTAVAVPVAVGLWLRRRTSGDRFGALLVAAALALGVVSLSASPDALLQSVGRVTQWTVQLGVIYVLLSFPTGRLTSSVDRQFLTAGAALLLLLYLPTVPITEQFPQPTPWSSCARGCPDNAFALVQHQPAVLDGVIRPVRELVTSALVLTFAVVLIRRGSRAKPLLRWTLMPVLAAGIVHFGIWALYLPARRLDSSSRALEVAGWIYLLTIPALALAVVCGLVARRVYVARVLERLAVNLESHAGAIDLREVMADSLEDPTLRLVYRAPDRDGWADERGRPVAAPQAGPGVAVTEVPANGRPVAAILHDPLLADEPAMLRAAAAHALVALDNERLIGRLRGSLDELARSRRRLVGVADQERRRIERDLHDGAQQGLVSLRIRLSMLEERLTGVAPEEAGVAGALGDQVEVAIDEVRALARGIYPQLLSAQGLAEALRAVVRTTPLPISLDIRGITRHVAEIESTVYFACLEALQNVAKHAPGARHVSVKLCERDDLRFEVSDDGPGFDGAIGEGLGLANMRDRVGAVGGRLSVRSIPGHGTVVAGTVPVGPANGAAGGRP